MLRKFTHTAITTIGIDIGKNTAHLASLGSGRSSGRRQDPGAWRSVRAERVQAEGLLLLAPTPTGKARVRTQELAGGAGIRAQTIAQFLNQNGRYDGRSGRYHLSEGPKATGFGSVIVDEASMLTEDMLVDRV